MSPSRCQRRDLNPHSLDYECRENATLCYQEPFYGCNLQMFVISQSVCPWQAFPAQFNVCGQGQGLRPYLQTLDQAGEACQGQTLQLITKIRKLRPQKVLQCKPQGTTIDITYNQLQHEAPPPNKLILSHRLLIFSHSLLANKAVIRCLYQFWYLIFSE